jgi:hypothetical protein
MKKTKLPIEKQPLPEDITPPPIFKTWAGMYWLVLGNLAFFILLFYLLTIAYA